jgi:hypothetical protein
MKRNWRRPLFMVSLVPITVFALGLAYKFLMLSLEGKERTLSEAIAWSAETISSTGYGSDGHWDDPRMVAFVVIAQFIGQGVWLAMLPFLVVPFIVDRFQIKVPSSLPKIRDFVMVYRSGAASDALGDMLNAAGIGLVVLEEDEDVARRLFEAGKSVFCARFDEDEPDLRGLAHARALVVDGSDEQNAAVILSARAQGYRGPILAFVQQASHCRPMILAGRERSIYAKTSVGRGARRFSQLAHLAASGGLGRD